MAITLRQALQRAAEVERGGEQFYLRLAEKTADPVGRGLFGKLARDERAHAAALEKQAATLPYSLDDTLDPSLQSLEAWRLEDDELSVEDAIAAALRAERRAEAFYTTLSRMTTGETRHFFVKLAQIERGHAERLKWWQSELEGL